MIESDLDVLSHLLYATLLVILSGGQYCAEGPENYYGKLLWIITMDNCGADLEEIAESTDTDGPTSLGAHR